MTDEYILPPMDYGTGAMPYPQQKSDRPDILERIDPERVADAIENIFLGKKWDEASKTWLPAKGVVPLSPRGAFDLAGLIRGTNSMNYLISNLTKEEINIGLLELYDTAMQMCIAHKKEYGIVDSTHRDWALEILFRNAKAVWNQGKEGFVMRQLGGGMLQQRGMMDYSSSPEDHEKKSWLKKLFGGRR